MPVAARGGNRKAPDHRTREAVAHRLELGLVGGQRAEAVVGLHDEDPRTDAFEGDDAGARERAAVDADVVRAEPGRNPGGVQHLGVQLRQLHPQPPAGLVPIERREAIELLEAGDPVVD